MTQATAVGEKSVMMDVNILRSMYLDLLKKTLVHSLWFKQEKRDSQWMHSLRKFAPSIFGHPRGTLSDRERGRVWPEFAHTMIGIPRMENIQHCVERVLADKVPGDLIETGVWRGGACIFMRAILKAYGITDRIVWAADSFEGLPEPNVDKAPMDRGDKHHTYPQLAVDLETVKRNFDAYGLLDGQVRFLKGWFKDTLPKAPIDRLAVCRLDGDMYESTMDAMNSLYPKLSIGGYLIVDDYGIVPGCRAAIDDYRREHGVSSPIEDIDGWGVFWRKTN